MLKAFHPLQRFAAAAAVVAIVLTGCASNKEKGAGPTGTGAARERRFVTGPSASRRRGHRGVAARRMRM